MFGFLLLRQFAKVSMVPNNVLVPIVIGISTISIFAIANSINDVYIMLLFGIIGYFMLKFGFSTAALVLGMVLSNTLEANFRRAQILAKGDLFGYFLTRSIAIVFVVLLILVLVVPPIMNKVKKSKAQAKLGRRIQDRIPSLRLALPAFRGAQGAVPG